MSQYQPISCDYHDFLLAQATLRKVCQIEYFLENEETTQTQAIILDIYTKNSSEFMVLDNDLTIRLDKIFKVNGQVLPNACM